MKWLKKVAATPLTSIARVIDSLSSTTNDRTNAPSINAVNAALNNLWEKIYPVGSIYMTVNNIDPTLIFGGTWERVEDTFLMAAGDSYGAGSTGGQATANYTPSGTLDEHKITTDELPSHKHQLMTDNITIKPEIGETYTMIYGTQFGTTDVAPAEIGQPSYFTNVSEGSIHFTEALEISGDTSYTGWIPSQIKGHNHTFIGAQGTINTIPPYLAVYVWKRIA